MDNSILNNEIHAAIHAMLSLKYEKDLCWTSVGLLSKEGDIEWDFRVNDLFIVHEEGNQNILCGPELHCKKPNKSLKICLKDETCKLKADFINLGEATKKENSLSLGILSKIHFREYPQDVQPYISLHKNVNFETWIVSKDDIITKLKLDSCKNHDDAKNYSFCAKKCMPNNATAVLVPLIQAHADNDFNHVGAIILCANKDCQNIWEHLPRIKATALSLIEIQRHIYRLTANRKIDLIVALFNNLFKYSSRNRLFEGQCTNTSCPLNSIRENHDRHGTECRIIQTSGTLSGLFTRETILLAKSLMAIDSDTFKNKSKVKYSHAVPIKQVVDFIRKVYNDIDITTTIEDELMVWPTSPGLISFAVFNDLYLKLSSHKNGQGVKKITIEKTIIDNTDKIYFSFCFKLMNIPEANELAAKWSECKPGGRNTTKLIKEAIKGNINKNIYDYNNDGFTKEEEEIIVKTAYPIYFLVFHDDELRLTWIVNGANCA